MNINIIILIYFRKTSTSMNIAPKKIKSMNHIYNNLNERNKLRQGYK